MKDIADTLIQRLNQGITTATAGKTIQIAHDFAFLIPENQVLALHGNLGAGKTTFVQGLAQAWNIPESITSPTFNLYSLYQGTRQLIHLDAYRLNSGADLEALMIDDFLSPPWCLAVEWPERIIEELPEDAWHLYLSIDSNRKHRIQFKTPTR
jgi:tRNA threonylcarbamoyladenosine biosynthesis protein TsaE